VSARPVGTNRIGHTLALKDSDAVSLVSIIRDFCAAHGIAESTFGRHAVNDGKFVSRISKGSWIAPETEQRVRAFMQKAERGEIVLRGRPRRKKSESRAYKMAELISQETSIRTPGSFAIHEQRHRFHVFAATTNEAWVHADIITEDLLQLDPVPKVFRIFYAPMDNGITLARVLRALHAHHPDVPVQVVLKGWGLEDLRNTMGRMVDRLSEHPQTVLVFTNLYTREAVELRKTTTEGPQDIKWHDVQLSDSDSYAFQKQVGALFAKLAPDWVVRQGEDDLPVYANPSVVCIYRSDQSDLLDHLIPRQGAVNLEFDYCFLNHPYLHSHTMAFRTDYVLHPVIRSLAPGGMMKVVQSLGDDPAHEMIRRVAGTTALKCVSRHDIISELRKTMGEAQRGYSFSGLTDATSLFRFDMHTLPVVEDGNIGALSLQGVWNNAVFFAQFREELAQATMRESDRYLQITRDVVSENGGLWFVNESFSVTRKSGP